MKPRHIVLVTGSLGEGAGGLASAVRALALGLADTGVKVGLFSLQLEQAFGPGSLPSHPLIENFVVPCLFEPRTRFTWAPALKPRLNQYCRTHNVSLLHTHGVWLAGTRTTARLARRLNLPYVVSPHGHLQPWAMNHKPFKKKLAWRGYGRRCLQRAALVHAGSQSELASVRRLGIGAPVAQVPNMVDLPAEWPNPRAEDDTRRTVLFLSRLHPSKGLLDLVAAWRKLRPAGWRVVVAGPDESGHLAEVAAAVDNAGLASAFRFVGAVPYTQRWQWYRAADLYVLPTYSENFGITVAEALGAGTPVITTRAAPWHQLAEQRCGWWTDTGPDALADALTQAFALSDTERAAMGGRGQALVQQQFSPSAVTQLMLTVYSWISTRGEVPDCVDMG